MRRRRTARWRGPKERPCHPSARARAAGPSARARAAVVGALLLGATAVLPGRPALAAGTPSPYAFAPDARPVTGAASAKDAALLTPGATYKSSLRSGGKTYYRLSLDATSDAYVSATAIPAPGSTASDGDGIKVTVRGPDDRDCSRDTETFGVAHSPRPIVAWGAREVSADRSYCRRGGTYYVIVERVGTANATWDTWDLELFATSEPRLKQAGATRAPEAWNSASPTPLSGEVVRREGGAGFASAVSVGQGVWSSDIAPGGTLFYKVPLTWGRQLYATAELDSSNSGTGSTTGALNLSLYNPARGPINDVSAHYSGRQKAAAELRPLPPVAYENRYDGLARYSGMRFAGSYYLVVHLSAEVAETYGDGPFRLTLRVRVEGPAEAGPDYAGESEPRGVFEVAAGDLGVAAGGQGGEGGGGGGAGGTAMTVLAVSGIGAGTVLLGVLGVWTVVARRRVRAW
nr:hypothetical protein [Streptomyces viridochromogenes]